MPPHLRSRSNGNAAEGSRSTRSVLVETHKESSDAETDIPETKVLDDADWHVEEQDLQDMFEARHPPEYYHRIANEIDDVALNTRNYSPGTLSLLHATEEDWKR